MDKRTAKREACWLVATVVRTSFDVGMTLDDKYGDDAELIEEQVMTLVAELERRGHR